MLGISLAGPALAHRSFPFGPALTQLPQSSAIFDRMSADTITGLTNGSGVATWAGVNGQMTATQGNAVQRPTFVANSLNGKPAVKATLPAPINGEGAAGYNARCQFMGFGANPALNAALTANQVAMLFVFHSSSQGRFGDTAPILGTAASGLGDGTASWVMDSGARIGSYGDDAPSSETGFHTLMVIRDNVNGQTSRLRYAINGMFVANSNISKFTAASSAGFNLFCGVNDNANDFFGAAALSDIVVWTGARITQADAIQAYKWACDKYAQPYRWSGLANIKVIAGDSIPSGAGLAHDNNVYALLKADLGFQHGQVSTISVGGIGLGEMRGQLQDDLDGITAQTGLPYRVVMGEWANSQGNAPANSQVAAMTNLIADRQAARAAGSKVAIWDSTALGGLAQIGGDLNDDGSTSAAGAGRVDYNTRVAALTGVDNFQAVSHDATIGVLGANPSSGTWPMTNWLDQKHLNVAAMPVLKGYYKAAFAAMG